MQVSQNGESAFILAVNAGSSSLKISLYNPLLLSHILSASFSNLSSPPAKFSVNHNSAVDLESVTDHASAFAHFVQYLNNDPNIQTCHIAFICHRVVHGGNYTDQTRVVIDSETYHHIESLSDLAPLSAVFFFSLTFFS
jgi:acetate kinase